jgi:hypothetical protein
MDPVLQQKFIPAKKERRTFRSAAFHSGEIETDPGKTIPPSDWIAPTGGGAKFLEQAACEEVERGGEGGDDRDDAETIEGEVAVGV